IVAPQCDTGARWENEPLMKLLDQARQRFNVDDDRVYLAGLSMGGYGTWKLGTTYSEHFAALIPICGGGDLIDVFVRDTPQKKAALKRLPIRAFHGAKD